MNAEPNAKSASTPRTGLFTLLCAVLGVKGGGAPSRTPCALAFFFAIAAALAFTSAPALAVAPERPEVGEASAVTATTATLEGGVLNPKAGGEVGEYEYRFRASETECEGERATAAEMAAGLEKEVVPAVSLGELQPNTVYTFCLIERNLAGETSPTSRLGHFATEPAPPEVLAETESASAVTGSGATLNATVNANNEPTIYKFEYSKSATGETLNAPVTTVAGAPPAAAVEGFGGQGVSVSTGAALAPDTTYHYRVVAENAQSGIEGKPVAGKVEEFTTATPPERPETISPAKLVTATTATFEGVLNPMKKGEAGSYEFLYRVSPKNCEGESVTPTEPAEAFGEIGEKVKAEVTAATPLQPNATYTFCLLARNDAGETSVGPAVHFTTLPAAPTVEGVATSTVTPVGARLEATVNPEHQPTTSCVFDYGETVAYGSQLPCEPASIEGFGGESVGANVAGLRRDTAYYYRVLVKNATGESEGAGKFVTNSAIAGQPTSDCPNPGHSGLSGRLPDCRAYEMLTPVDLGDAKDMFGEANANLPGAEGGDITDVGYPDDEGDKFYLATAAAFGPFAAAGENAYVFSRGPGGWQETSLAPHTGGGAPSIEADPFFSPDFSHVAVNESFGSDGNHPALRNTSLIGPPGGPYTTLVDSPFQIGSKPFVGASSDFGRVFFESTEHGFAAPAQEQLPGSAAIYEYTAGHYSLVNVNSEGKLLNPCGAVSPTTEGEPVTEYSHAVSTDGSRVFFLSPDREDGSCYQESLSGFTGTPPELYLRSAGRTIEVSEPEKGVSDLEGPQPVAFAGASADGSRVFFVTRGELTANDQGNHDPELYEYDVETEKLTRISSGDSHSAVGDVGWVVPSEDGSTVYFTATGQLAPGAALISGQPSGPNESTQEYNLYRYDTETATTTYIATVSGSDWSENPPFGVELLNISEPINANSNWETTSDGGYLLFAAVENLTGYDSHDPTGHCRGTIAHGNGDGDCAEVYRYDAADGRLICISCNPSGAVPSASALFDRNTHAREVRAISDDGAYVFFDTTESLVPAATDERLNVYEWHEGEISLISSGQDASNSYFLGTDASGADVFFGSHARLVPQDTDSSGNLYDARIDGGFPVAQGSAACEGDACQSPPPPPAEATPASLTFSGGGDLVSEPPPEKAVTKKTIAKCKKGFTRKKNKCVKGKAKKKVKKTERVGNDRRASR